MLDDQEQRDQKSEVADAVDDERFLPGRCRRIFCEPEPDQQIRRQAHALPADEHQQVVVGQHQRQHEKHEQVQVGEEAVVAGVVPHVADGVDVDQESDSGDDQQHDQRELIEIEGEIGVEAAGKSNARADPVGEVLVVGKPSSEIRQTTDSAQAKAAPEKNSPTTADRRARRLLPEKAVDGGARQRQDRDQPEKD